MTTEDSLRRQLRFSLFLQGVALLMFAGAFLVRAFAVGVDALTVLFGVLCLAVVAAIAFTVSRIRALT